MRNMVYANMVNLLNITFAVIVTRFTFFIVIIIFLNLGHKTSTELLFYVFVSFGNLQLEFGVNIPQSLSRIAQFYVTLLRLNKALLAQELKQIHEIFGENPSVSMRNAAFVVGNKEILKGVSVNVNGSELTAVTGIVGSGKSSLLKVILGDYQPLTQGNL